MAQNPIALGWAYQIWNEPERDTSSWGVSHRDALQHERLSITAATQIFTERHMAVFLCERAALGGAFGGDILDPACGAGHLLVEAFGTMRRRYPGTAAEVLLTRLHGLDIDPFAVGLCRATLLAAALRCATSGPDALLSLIVSRVRPVAKPWGTLERELSATELLLARRYGCILANPPYLGRRKLPQVLREWLDREYPDTSMDLCSAFMERCLELLEPHGWIGLVTNDKWLRLRGHRALRVGGARFSGMYRELSLDSLVELGDHAFDSRLNLHDGVGIVLLSGMRRVPPEDHELQLITLSAEREYARKAELLMGYPAGGENETRMVRQELLIAERHDEVFLESGGVPRLLALSARKVGDVAQVVVGLQTNDDARFVRQQWEVEPDLQRWRVHARGGGYSRWFGLNRWVLDWQGGEGTFRDSPRSGISAEGFFDRSGWVYSWFANGCLGIREKGAGWSFGRAAASGFFCDDIRVVAFLNSRIASVCARRIGGKVQLPEGIVRRLPLPPSLEPIDPELVRGAVALKRWLVRLDPRDLTFDPEARPSLEEELAVQALLLMVEMALERQVHDAVGERSSSATDPLAGALLFGSTPAAESVRQALPDEFHHIFRLLEPLPSQVTDKLLKIDDVKLEALVVSGQRNLAAQGMVLPSDSEVERWCRSVGAHPFALVSRLAELCKRRAELRRCMESSRDQRVLLTELLRQFSHRWWGVEYPSRRHMVGWVSFEDLGRELRAAGWREPEGSLKGMPLPAWLAKELPAWQRRIFGLRGPLVEVPGRQGGVVHRWDLATMGPGRSRPKAPSRISRSGDTRASSPARST